MNRSLRIILFFALIVGCARAQYEDAGKRGLYYSKKNLTEASIPSFIENKSKLPSPILENNPEYVELYWKAWSLAFDHFKAPLKGSPFVSNYIDEAFSPNIFQWDTIFMIMFARYAHFVFPSIQSLDNFYCRQYENGYICREIQENNGEDFVYEAREHTVNPPLFAWAEIENYTITGDTSRFSAVLPVLQKYAEWLEKYRKKENTAHGLYWNTGLGSGMDNMPLHGSGWVDMSSQMVLMYRALATISSELHHVGESKTFEDRARTIAQRINQYMWNETDGFYYNVDDGGKQQKLKNVGGFWPMLAGVADRGQAERLLAQLKDPKFFWRTIPFPSLAADEKEYKADGQYWLGSVWASTNVEIIKGLDRFGTEGDDAYSFNEFAKLATETYLDGIYNVYRKTGTLWENYSPESYSRGLWSRPDFVGWTGCGPIELLIENVLGFRPDGAHKKLVWFLSRIDRHGIEHLRFGDVDASLIAQHRKDLNASAKISVDANVPFDLVVVKQFGKTISIHIHKGPQRVTIQ
jgi:glycogen debranching enzyme